MALRQKLNATVLTAFLNFTLILGSELHGRLFAYLPKENEHDMDVNTATSGTQTVAKHSLPELEIYCYFLVLIFLIDLKRYNKAKACALSSIVQLKNMIRRTVDFSSIQALLLFSYSYELTGGLAEKLEVSSFPSLDCDPAP
ncbi:probable 26S proteasome non-ATPase regulatory subunit 3 [Quercus lobata]|nr:probable 26S proteasome non-ATPase regulatory subunit 3 [Quercus lobata]